MSPRWILRGTASAMGLGAILSACTKTGDLETDTARFEVAVTNPDGSPVSGPDAPACVDLRGANPACPPRSTFLVTVEAKNRAGERDTSFNGFARLSISPGSLVAVAGDSAAGRNVRLAGGVAAEVEVQVTGTYGEARVLAEDLGYVPVVPSADRLPGCADGIDNDNDGLVDFPADPGCAFANDDTEQLGTFAAGVSPPISFKLPTVAEAQGLGPATPYPEEGIQIDTESAGVNVIVIRVSSDGFYVTDLAVDRDAAGEVRSAVPRDYGSLFVFNFGIPAGMRVCDRLTLLAGTMTEFFGYTEMSFPSFRVKPWVFRPIAEGGDGKCLVPEPKTIATAPPQGDGDPINTRLEKVEAGLVRVSGGHVSRFLGPDNPDVSESAGGANGCAIGYSFTFAVGRSNCDFTKDGKLDFTPCGKEGACSDACLLDLECSEYSSFQSRGNFRIVVPPEAGGGIPSILANTGTVPNFSPVAYAGRPLVAITGTLANFSGGKLNWTIETRCTDDLVYCRLDEPECLDSPPEPMLSESACVKPRTVGENDAQ